MPPDGNQSNQYEKTMRKMIPVTKSGVALQTAPHNNKRVSPLLFLLATEKMPKLMPMKLAQSMAISINTTVFQNRYPIISITGTLLKNEIPKSRRSNFFK